jgi:hypothetical protein
MVDYSIRVCVYVYVLCMVWCDSDGGIKSKNQDKNHDGVWGSEDRRKKGIMVMVYLWL